jgi:hypothetical protein
MLRENEKDDYIEAGKPVHRLSYCAFLDILGFSERIRSSYKAKTANALLQEFHKIFDKRINRLKSDVGNSLLYFKSFSDNILLAHPRFSNDMESEFAFILWSISEYQFEMALQGFFIRGGLSVGPLFVDANSVYGEALIDAYELESKVAVNPIVVLCEETKRLVNHHIGYYHGEVPPQVKHVLVNADGRYFINYLAECVTETLDGELLDVESLRKHRDQIERALEENAGQPAVFAKFLWLSAYHNHFCDSVSLCQGYSDDLKVKAQLATVVSFKTLGKS